MSNYTKVSIKREVLEIAKTVALVKNRSVANLIESLVIQEHQLIKEPSNVKKEDH